MVLEDGVFRYKVDGGLAEAFCVNPKAGRPIGQVIVIHEVWGFTRFIQGICSALSREGFRAVAPMLYWRHKALFSPETVRAGMKVVWDLSLSERYRPEDSRPR